MKNKPDFLEKFAFLKGFDVSRIRTGPCIATVLAFLISVIAVFSGMRSSRENFFNLGEFEVGRVADRDVSAEESISYEDTGATRLRLEAQERLSPAVFTVSPAAADEARDAYSRFTALSEDLFAQKVSGETYRFAVQSEFPGAFYGDTLDILFRDPGREHFFTYAREVLEYLLSRGIFALPKAGLELYNPDGVELLHGGIVDRAGDDAFGTEREWIPYDRIITKENLNEGVDQFTSTGTYPTTFAFIAPDLLRPFITENVFFSYAETEKRLEETRAAVEPVMRQIERGDRIIRKGFIITEEDAARLRALDLPASRRDARIVAGDILLFLLIYCLLLFLAGNRTVGRRLSPAEAYLLCVLAAFYFTTAVFAKGLAPLSGYFPSAIVLPTALVVMLPSILINPSLAMVMAMVLPLGAFLSGSLDTPSYIFALTSGIVAAYVLQGAERRMDLVKAGFVIAAANCIAALSVLLIQRVSLAEYPMILFWAAFNGIASGMLVLGLLPLMEHALNAVTPFRLIELSDLNAPVLKRLFTAAPGTYSHSIMVANLAEAASQEIGANALLARVGAYYHDIGKIDQPDYFVENQTIYNKHNDLNPRLSATVIRSHVKVGMEKARSLGLPQAVVDIIAEHHGSSVITWFYNEALKRETSVNIDDFTYPGTPPHSRESAVVMLADVSEAAVRTLKKPNAAKLEKFIQELIMSKFQQGQLAESELTFRDLGIIKKAFVKVLAGHYHSRIEYPKLPKEALGGGGSS